MNFKIKLNASAKLNNTEEESTKESKLSAKLDRRLKVLEGLIKKQKAKNSEFKESLTEDELKIYNATLKFSKGIFWYGIVSVGLIALAVLLSPLLLLL